MHQTHDNNTNSNNRRMNLADQAASSNANPSAAELRRRHLSDLWATNADTVYNMRSNNFKSNYVHLQRVFGENDTLLQPLLERCPSFVVILAYILEDRFALRLRSIDWMLDLKEWQKEDSRRVGCALAFFLRKRKTGRAGLDAWRLHFSQLNILFEEVEGFETFMNVVASNLLKDNKFGMFFRVW